MDSSEIETLVNELETRVDRLRALYEQYFMGIERMPPSVPHKDVERRLQVLRKEQIRNTGVRFRFQMILQRYNTYQTHWQRICRQIEEGTYKRDLLRAQRRIKPAEVVEPEPPPPPPPAREVMPEEAPTKKVALAEIDELRLDDFADLDRVLNAPVADLPVPPKPAAPAGPRPQWRKIEKPVAAAPPPPQPQPPQPQPKPAPPAPPPPLPKKPPPPVPTAQAKPPQPAPPQPAPPKPAPAAPPRSPADIPDDRMRQLYSQYVQTRRAQNESTAAITYDAMAKSIRESSAKLREKHGKAVDFEVAVKDGKTILKPVVKPK